MFTNEKVQLKHSKFSLCSELEDSRSKSSNMYFIHKINYIGKYINKYRFEGDYMMHRDQSCCNSTDILQLQKLQNREARIVTNSPFDASSKPLIQSLGWKTIEELIDRQVNLTVFKCLNSTAPKYLCDIFTKNTVYATRSLRNTNTDLRLPLKSSANGQK